MNGRNRLRVCWRGDFFTGLSFAFVNRRLVRALLERDNVEVTLCTDPVVAELLEPEFREFAALAARGNHSPDFTVANDVVPLKHGVPADTRFVRYTAWEFGSMPKLWYDALHVECDDLWLPSTCNVDAFAADGFPADRLAVVPYGVDPSVFRPPAHSRSEESPFRFLFIGATIPRKGIDILINAYFRAFTRDDNVLLTVKDVNTQTFYRGKGTGAEIAAFARMPLARLEYMDATFTDRDIVKLFGESDCFVLPSRGEGFALPVLEAMACGLPVIVTDGGATDDFVDESVGWRIPSKRIICAPGEPVPTLGTAWLLEADVQALAHTLRYVYEHRDEARARGQAGIGRAAQWTWNDAAAIVEQRLFELAERSPVPSIQRGARYRDALRYADVETGPSRIDGILLELFRRITVQSPQFVEITWEPKPQLASILAEGMRWNGVLLNPSMRETAALEAVLRSAGIRDGFDLLAIACDGDAAVWKVVQALRPRALVTADSADAPHAALRALDYTFIVREEQSGHSLFVRNDLVEAAGFTPAAAAATLR